MNQHHHQHCRSFFVYGTLMRGQARESLWPISPREICSARVRGVLYDLGEYPALVLGDGWVEGELWTLAPGDVRPTLNVLDDVEDCPDLYVRTVCHVITGIDSTPIERFGFVYVYADIAGIPGAQRIPAGPDGVQRWARR